MAKKIRFPLEMKDGIEVRDLEELKEYFSLERILFYLVNGKLEIWLRDRYLDDLADAISGLDMEDMKLNQKICDIFEIEYMQEEEENPELIMEKEHRRALLREYTEKKEYFDVIDQIAFDQDDMYDLLDEGETTVYLCGDKFSIPLSKKGICYIGVNNPTVVISSKVKIDFKEKDISFEDVQFDERYQKLLDEEELKTETLSKERSKAEMKYGNYCANSYMNFMLSAQDKAGAKNCYEKICVLMEGIKYDVDADIRELRKKLLDSGIAGMAREYLREL